MMSWELMNNMKYEYKEIFLGNDVKSKWTELLNNEGEIGWDLVFIDTFGDGKRVTFKRPK